MTYSRTSHTTGGLARSAVLAAIGLVGAVAIGVAVSPLDRHDADPRPTAGRVVGTTADKAGQSTTGATSNRKGGRPPASALAQPGPAGAGGTVFDDRDPAVANLDPTLLAALRRAATDAAEDRISFHVNSGWRSAAYQEQLLQDAIAKYGSEKEAARWVATPQTSAHVSGDAVDLGPAKAAKWLSGHGAAYGLCQIYRNEPWHYELRSGAVSDGCPVMYADPTQDPRMQQ